MLGGACLYLIDCARSIWVARPLTEARTDNGPEFTCRAFMTWAQKHCIKHILIEPGSPTQNAYIESFNGTFRY